MMERDELAAWLRLLETPGIGRTSARRLLTAFGSPQAVFDAPLDAVAACIDVAKAALLATPHSSVDALVDDTLGWLDTAAQTGVQRSVLTLADADYPALLLESADPPLLLYAQGDRSWLGRPSVAVVGSRNPTTQGVENARAFAAELSRGGVTVVSGLALGIDGAAHDGGLSGPGRTVAVCGTGLDRVYPSRHRALAHRIASDGLMLSEHPLGTPPLKENFPGRNRIIAGLSSGCLVVEAALQSGSLITARLSLESSREVFAIPGSIHSAQSRGCHWLIKQGAKLVETAQDILEELKLTTPPAATSGSSGSASPQDDASTPGAHFLGWLLDALGHDPMSLDALVARTGRPAQDINAHLLELEMDDLVARLPGQVFQRRGRA